MTKVNIIISIIPTSHKPTRTCHPINQTKSQSENNYQTFTLISFSIKMSATRYPPVWFQRIIFSAHEGTQNHSDIKVPDVAPPLKKNMITQHLIRTTETKPFAAIAGFYARPILAYRDQSFVHCVSNQHVIRLSETNNVFITHKTLVSLNNAVQESGGKNFTTTPPGIETEHEIAHSIEKRDVGALMTTLSSSPNK